jgi:hypothetical protein
MSGVWDDNVCDGDFVESSLPFSHIHIRTYERQMTKRVLNTDDLFAELVEKNSMVFRLAIFSKRT